MEGFINIAIDGPAGAGKSTIAKAVAQELGILYLDTGAMYRAMAYKALQLGLDPRDRETVLPMLASTVIDVSQQGGAQHTFVDGQDVTALIRTQVIAKGASDISAIPEVRALLVKAQQRIARGASVVMDGRDIGSVVLPNTPYKFYVTATIEERAARRLRELQAKGEYLDRTAEQVAKELELRDHNDSTRACAPLKRMPDAIVIDTTALPADAAVQAVMQHFPKGLWQRGV